MRGERAAQRASNAVLLTAAALLVLHLGQLAHLALVPHGICAEHGEMVEVGAAPAVSGPSAAALPGAAMISDRAQPSDHAHCPVLYGRREAITPAPPVVRVLALHPPPDSLAAPVVWPPDFSGRLDLAPKQSPPAA